MGRIVFIHNPHDKDSRDLLDEVRVAHPETQVLDSMDVRESVWFQGTPSVILLPSSAPQISDFICWQKDINPILADIEDALTRARVLTLTSDKAQVLAGGQFTLTVTAVDLDGNPASIPADTIIGVSGFESIPDAQGRVTVTSNAAGVAECVAYSDFARSSYCEVVVGG